MIIVVKGPLSRTIRAKQSSGARCIVLPSTYCLLGPKWYSMCVYIYTHIMVRDVHIFWLKPLSLIPCLTSDRCHSDPCTLAKTRTNKEQAHILPCPVATSNWIYHTKLDIH